MTEKHATLHPLAKKVPAREAPAKETPDDAPEVPKAGINPEGPLTLTLDVGGTGIKGGVLDRGGAIVGERARVLTPHPSPPDVVVPMLVHMAGHLGAFDRVSIGFPGVVRDGRVLTAPNLGTPAWAGFGLAAALAEELGKPVRMENDATVQGLGVVGGHGLECVMTLGTGVGFALYKDGRLAPHLELSQHIFRGRKTYDQALGVAELARIGKRRWKKRVRRMLDQVRTLVNFDVLYLGGGDAKLIDFELPHDIRLVSNDAGITGGVRLWDSQLDFDFRTALVPNVIPPQGDDPGAPPDPTQAAASV